MIGRGLRNNTERGSLSGAYSGDPFIMDATSTNYIREATRLIENEFYRPVEFRPFIYPTPKESGIYEEQVFKKYIEPGIFIHANVVNNVQALLYLPQGVAEGADVALEISSLELEKANYNPKLGADIFISDGVMYETIKRWDKDVAKDIYLNTVITGKTLNKLVQPPQPFSVEA